MRHRPFRLPFSALLAALVAASGPASATTLNPEAVRTTFHRADFVLEGDVTGSHTELRPDGLPITEYRIDVVRTLKGGATGEVRVRIPGGWTERAFVHVSGAPMMRTGDRVLMATQLVDAERGIMHMTTFGAAFARSEGAWGGPDLAVDTNGRPLVDYGAPLPIEADAASLEVSALQGACELELAEPEYEVLTWEDVLLAWEIQVLLAASEPEWHDGVELAEVVR